MKKHFHSALVGMFAASLFCLPTAASAESRSVATLAVDPLTIQDKPSILHVDISRHFRTKEELKKIIDSMAMHKLNTLHLHLTDDDGWRVENKAYPQLTTVGAIGSRSNPNAPAAFLTQEDVKELCAYSALGLWYWSKNKPALLQTLPDEKKTPANAANKRE
ncbi:MAG: family 20 glycosylhydrolase [Spartobacteria bacterium]